MALGADRRRVVRQLLTESLLLAVLSSMAGLLLSTIALRTMQTISDMPEGWGMALDWRALAATLAIALVAAATFGLAPALRLTSGAPQAGCARSVFLALQVGASCMFLMVAGQLVRGFERLVTADPGFDYSRVVVIQPGLGAHGYKGVPARSYLQTLRDRLLSIPGVQRTSVMELAPWGTQAWHEGGGGYRVNFNRVDAEFLPTLGLRLLRGRNFLPGEKGVAIVSASVARRLWPGQDPLGKSLEMGDGGTVIGVVESAGTFNLRTEDPMGVYFPLKANDGIDSALVARVAGPPGKYLEALAASAKVLDRRLQPNVRLLQPEFDRAKGDSLQLVSVVGLLGILATLLAMIGLAGLTAYTVAQRTREIGVRIALGARRSQVVKAVLKPLLRPVSIGFLAGTLGAVGLSSVLRSEIFGLRLLEPMAYLMAIALFTAVVALATMAPARRAMRVNPTEALRHE
jgi:predicted permease